MRFTSLLTVAVAALAMAPVRGQSLDPPAIMARVESAQPKPRTELDRLTLQELMAHFQVPGVSVAVVQDHRLHWAKAYGVADVATGRLLTTETRLQAASISKPITALAALRLVESGQLNLDADVNAYLKSWKVPRPPAGSTQAVTPRALFSHTSGADDGFGFPGYEPGTPLPTALQILEGQAPSNVGPVRFTRAPYQAYKYSGGGLTVIQLALTEITGQAFGQVLQELVLAPLQMSNSTFEPLSPQADRSKAGLAHDKHGQRMGAPWHVYPEQAAAGLWTTPTDLAKFIIELQTALGGPSGRLIQRSTAREMVTPTGIGRFAIGLQLDLRGEDWYFSHNGSNWGYRAWMTGHVRRGHGMVIMTNGENGLALMNQIADRVTAAYRWDA